MLNAHIRLIGFAMVAALSAWSHSSFAQSNDAPPRQTVATVNGRPISQIAMDSVAEQIRESGEQADAQSILDELINLEVLTQAAEELRLDKNAEISAALQLQYIQTMANAYLAHKSAEISISDDDLRAEYDAQLMNAELSEYRASHILLETEREAKMVLMELSDGKSFAAAAKEHSIDSGGNNGGDLGWFVGSSMVPPFATAIAKMNIGEITTTPVKTDFGYHIINLLDKRNAALPSFEAVKTGLTNLVVRKTLAAHVEELKLAADISRQ